MTRLGEPFISGFDDARSSVLPSGTCKPPFRLQTSWMLTSRFTTCICLRFYGALTCRALCRIVFNLLYYP